MTFVEAEPPATATPAPTLTALLAVQESPAGSLVEYVIGGQELTGAKRELAAQMLAEDAMQIRCGKASVLDRWRARRDGGPRETGARSRAVEVYVKLGFGLPDAPANDDHLQGLVAELLWNRLVQERLVCRDGRRLVHAHPVKADPLETGGDGLLVYANDTGTLVFRLWEIKKHDSQAKKVSATIGRASKQLSSRGQEYLAKLAGPETVEQEGPLGDLYADIVELWLDRSERAGAGVSIGTSKQHAPTRASAFRSLATAFPDFTEPGQIESIVVAVPEFPMFAARVREIVWSGL
ncbi:hypothetical protein GCM10023194_25750 [Planotetraspora phitsanulokensis]|uniref:Uncharacterized protein n=1 Tax=Planotetraspora phitsanulokensis TaxID=575192 RepID=A0A8J3UE10_9ACTN|nr:hypothetical protein [Planotetraspora phitsanulokensis]GII41922.1 hypothetical protein Pph01_69250 [Planotetraspora phitsanulokensis]